MTNKVPERPAVKTTPRHTPFYLGQSADEVHYVCRRTGRKRSAIEFESDGQVFHLDLARAKKSEIKEQIADLKVNLQTVNDVTWWLDSGEVLVFTRQPRQPYRIVRLEVPGMEGE